MDNESSNNHDDSKRRRRGKYSDVKKNQQILKENRTIPTSRLEKLAATSRRSNSCMLITVSDDDDDDNAGALSNSRQAPVPSLNHSHRSLSSCGSSARSLRHRSFNSNISIINNIIDSDKESSCRRNSNNSSNSSFYSNSSGYDDNDYQKQMYVVDDFNSDIEDEDDDEEEDHVVKVDIRVPINIGEHVQAPGMSSAATPKNHGNSTRSQCQREGGKKSRSEDRLRRRNKRIGELEHGDKSQLETTTDTYNKELESEVIHLITDSTKGKVIKKKASRTENFPDKEQYPDKVVSIQSEGIFSRSHRSHRQRSSKGRLTKKDRSRSRSCDLLGTSIGHMGRRSRIRSSSSINNVYAESRKGMKKLSGGTTQSEEETIVASNTHHQTIAHINTTTLEDRPFIKERKKSSLNTSGKEDDKLESPCQNTGREERRTRRLKKLTKERRNDGYSTGESRKDRNTNHRSSRRLKDRKSCKKGQTRSRISRSINHKDEDQPENLINQSSRDDSVMLDNIGPVIDTLEKLTRPSEPINESNSQDLAVCFNDQGDINSKLNNEDIIKFDLNLAVCIISHLDKNPKAGTQNVAECSVLSRDETTEESQGIDSRKSEDEKRMFDDTKKIEDNLHKLDSRTCVKSYTASDNDPSNNGTEFKKVDLETVTTTNKSNNGSENLLNQKESRNRIKERKGKNAKIATTISDKGKRKSSRKLRKKKNNDVVQRNSISEPLVGSIKSTTIDPIHKFKADDSEFDSSNSKFTKVSHLEVSHPRSDKYLGSKANKKVHNSKEKSSISLNDLFSKSEHYSDKEMIPLAKDSESLPPPSLASDASLLGNTNRSHRNDTQMESAVESDEMESEKKGKQHVRTSSSLRSHYNNNGSITDDQVAIAPVSSKEKTNKIFSRLFNDLDEHINFVHATFDDDNDGEHTRKKKRNGMLQKMRKATSNFTESGRTTVKKAASTRNLFEQATIKVFARGKEEGKGLLRSDSDY